MDKETELRIHEVTTVLNMVLQGMHVTHHVAAAALNKLYRGAYAHMLSEYTCRPDLLMPTYVMVNEKLDKANLDCVEAMDAITGSSISADAILIDQEDSDRLN